MFRLATSSRNRNIKLTTLHFSQLMTMLRKQGADCDEADESAFFFELRFEDQSGRKSGTIDEDYKNAVITADCPYGNVTILFDE